MYEAGSLWNKWDLHIHTDASDGKGSCQDILKEAAAKELKCIAIQIITQLLMLIL